MSNIYNLTFYNYCCYYPSQNDTFITVCIHKDSATLLFDSITLPDHIENISENCKMYLYTRNTEDDLTTWPIFYIPENVKKCKYSMDNELDSDESSLFDFMCINSIFPYDFKNNSYYQEWIYELPDTGINLEVVNADLREMFESYIAQNNFVIPNDALDVSIASIPYLDISADTKPYVKSH